MRALQAQVSAASNAVDAAVAAAFALRRAYADVEADPGVAVVLRIEGEWKHAWTVTRGTAGWDLFDGAAEFPAAAVSMDTQTAWRSFFNFRSSDETRGFVGVAGERRLAGPILRARSVMIREAVEGA